MPTLSALLTWRYSAFSWPSAVRTATLTKHLVRRSSPGRPQISPYSYRWAAPYISASIDNADAGRTPADPSRGESGRASRPVPIRSTPSSRRTRSYAASRSACVIMRTSPFGRVVFGTAAQFPDAGSRELRRPPAVDRNDRSRDERGAIGREKGGHLGRLLGSSRSVERGLGAHLARDVV